MSGFDVEALLEETAREFRLEPPPKQDDDNSRKTDRSSEARSTKNRDRDLLDGRGRNGDDRHSDSGSIRSSRRHRSRSVDRRSRRDDDDDRYYRPSGRSSRNRSRSPDDDRHYRPSHRDDRHRERRRSRDRYRDREGDRDGAARDRDRGRDADRDRERDRHDDKHRASEKDAPRGGRAHKGGEKRRSRSKSLTLNEDERDRRTVFVQQLAARLRSRELQSFFEQVGQVREAQIVKDRVSGRSKGVGYVEFVHEESVPKAIELTGQKLLGIPIIAQLTEAEKNRQARNTETQQPNAGAPFHRLYVGNIHFSITEEDLENVFKPFGETEFVQLQKEEQGRSRGYGFVQFRDPAAAKEALEKMNGFDLAGRPIRVGLGNDKFTDQTTANLLQRFPNGQGGPGAHFQGSAFSGAGGRGYHAGGANSFDRAGGRDDRAGGAGGASALDDTDVNGVNFKNVSRHTLMQKLARVEDDTPKVTTTTRAAVQPVVNQPQPSRCVKVSNVFDVNEELAHSGPDWKDALEKDIREECEDKYGKVIHCAADPESSTGDFYIKFADMNGGKKAMQGLNGRFFGGRRLTCSPLVDAFYNTMFGRAAGA